MTVAERIPYAHLLGQRWEDMDCRAVVRAVYLAAGVPLPAGALEAPPVAGCWERVADRWSPAGSWEALDVIASDEMRTGCESHVGVLVTNGRPWRPWSVVTSYILGGVVARRPGAIKEVRGIYRLRKELPR